MTFRFSISVWALLCIACLHRTLAADTSRYPWAGEEKLVQFDLPLPTFTNAATSLEYNYNLTNESFRIFVPKNYTGREPFGLFAFMNAADEMHLPEDWASVMEKEKLICLMPQRIGNNQLFARRLGLTMVGIRKTMEQYKIDPKRVYSGGMSGGARCSLQLAYLHNETIAGNISICGANFYTSLPRVKAPTNSADYGYWPVPPDKIAETKKKVRFVFITGSGDFRYGNILDIYREGFAKNGFRAKLIDQPGMGHELCSPESLTEAFHFVENKP